METNAKVGVTARLHSF